jgi:hypothetical protein
VAAAIKQQLGIDPDIMEGARGEFSIWVGAERVAQKGADGFPSDEEALSAVKSALSRK